MKLSFRLATLLIGAAAIAIGAVAVMLNKPTIVRYGVEANYKPMIWDEHGTPQGISVKQLTDIERSTNLRFQPTLVGELPKLIAALERGDIDMITSVTKTETRSKVMDFTAPYANIRGFIYSTSASQHPTKIIGVGKSFAMEDYVRKNFPGSEIRVYDDDRMVFGALISGEITGAAIDELSMAIMDPPKGIVLKKTETTFEYKLAFAFRKGLGHLVNKVSANLNTVQIQVETP